MKTDAEEPLGTFAASARPLCFDADAGGGWAAIPVAIA